MLPIFMPSNREIDMGLIIVFLVALIVLIFLSILEAIFDK